MTYGLFDKSLLAAFDGALSRSKLCRSQGNASYLLAIRQIKEQHPPGAGAP